MKKSHNFFRFNPWDHQDFKKINASYQTGLFLKVSGFNFVDNLDMTDTTNESVARTVQPQTVSQPVSINQKCLVVYLCAF